MTGVRSRIVLIAPLASIATAAAVLLAGETMVAQNNFPKPPGIERLDPALDQLIAPDATIEVLAGGYDWTEGPVWVKDGGYLLFSDIPPNRIHRWKQGEGAKLYLTPSGYTGTEPRGGEVGSNGLTLDREGRLVLAQHGDRRIARMDAPLSKPQPKFTTLADRFQKARFNSPERRGVPQQRRHLLHRSRLRDGEAVGRPEARDELRGRLPAGRRRHRHPADQGNDPAERYRLLARRAASVCRAVGSCGGRHPGVRREGRRQHRQQPRALRRHGARQIAPGSSRRPEDRHRRQPLGDRPRRRARDHASKASTSGRSRPVRPPATARLETTAGRCT